MSLHYSKTQLKNGLRIITAPKHDTNAVAVLILVKVGSRYETEAQAGLSHFLEHMFFKGTRKRPTYLHVSKELDGLGANFNAFTSEEYTGFYVQTSGDHFDQALDVLADMLLNGQGRAWPRPSDPRRSAWLPSPVSAVHSSPRSRL